MTKPTGERRVKGWGGFVYDHIDRVEGEQYGYATVPTLRAIYTNKKDAIARYVDVRPVTITYSLPITSVRKQK